MKIVDDNKRIAADHLKTADKLIKAGEFDHANEEIAKARVADPRNLYILAYEERIQYAREEAEKKAEKESAKEPIKEQPKPPAISEPTPQPASAKAPASKIEEPSVAAKEKPEPAPPKPDGRVAKGISDNGQTQPAVALQDKHPNFEEFVIRVNDIDSILELIQTNADRAAKKSVEEARDKAQAEYKSKIEGEIQVYEQESQKRQAEQIQVAVATFQKRLETEAQVKLENEISEMSKVAEKHLEERLLHLEDERELRFAEIAKELFTIAIEQLLVQGLSDEDYTKVITGIAHGLKISPEQTLHMKKKTQERYYMDAVEVAWSDGTVSLEESERLAALRDRFGISAEDHFHIESLVRRKMLDVKK